MDDNMKKVLEELLWPLATSGGRYIYRSDSSLYVVIPILLGGDLTRLGGVMYRVLYEQSEAV